MPVVYNGILPDLFKEGKGVVAQGQIGPDGMFHATEVLAKHDENYMPPEAADAVNKAHGARRGREDRQDADSLTEDAPMIPELGHFALILALLLALVLGTLPLVGARAAHPGAGWRSRGRSAQGSSCSSPSPWAASPTRSSTATSRSLNVAHQLQLAAAAPLPDRGDVGLARRLDAAVGADARGLDARGLAREPAPARRDGRARARRDGPRRVGFLLFMLLTSNPFERLFPVPADGRDLNPLLQDPGMVVHPPMLYMGYVGFSVAFAFAIAALLGGRLDATWARWSRPWTTLAWCFLTIGIMLGSWWAYYELGWGGWWFWDPVENASFMPWLVGTALIHSLAVTEKRGTFKSWTVLLAIFAFSLSLLGTFLVRSGVLTSVHAFATDPRARRVHPRVPRRSSSAARWRCTRCARRRSAAAAASTSCRASRCCSPTTCCCWSPRARCCSARSIRCSSTRSTSARSPSARRTSTRCSCR